MSQTPVFLLTAVRNEAAVIDRFLEELSRVFTDGGLLSRMRLIIVDDGSTDQTIQHIARWSRAHPELSVEVMPLSSNQGNQSAMAHGVRRLAPRLAEAYLLTFDADGEDDLTRLPQLVRLLDEDPARMVFVYRDGRSEGWIIRVFYWAYRNAYRWLTGQRLIPCNVMAIPGHMIPAVAGSPLLSLHFSYPPLRLGLPHRAIPMARRPRYAGRSSQNLGLLIQHGLIGLTVFYEQVVARLILLSLGVVAVTGFAAVWIMAVRILTPHRLPVGLTTTVFVLLIGFGFLSIVLLVVFCLACAIFRLLMEQARAPQSNGR